MERLLLLWEHWRRKGMTDSATWAAPTAKWVGPTRGDVRIGSDQHKQLFCRMLLDTYDPYKPAVIPWPKLEPAALARLTGLPIWGLAVETEGYAGLRMQAMADVTDDPLIREAIALNAFEERRHKEVLAHMIRFYGIEIGPEPDYRQPSDPEWMFVRTGYGEFIDSFFAFGLFTLAKNSGFFPLELVEVFEPVIQEEVRHNLFFANWLAYQRARSPLWRLPGLFARRLGALGVELRIRMHVSNKIDQDNFTMRGSEAMGFDLTFRELIDLCLTENDRRFALYDDRLVRPKMVARPARLVSALFGKPRRAAP
jgi:hypothetical protein